MPGSKFLYRAYPNGVYHSGDHPIVILPRGYTNRLAIPNPIKKSSFKIRFKGFSALFFVEEYR